jgi:hypothetical protein
MPLPVSMDATWLNGSTSFNAQELRRADSANFDGDGTAFGVRGGIVRHGDNSLAVTVNASDVVTVQPGAVAIPGNSGVGNGVYCSALGAAETGNLTARNATLPRIDLVVFRVLDTDVVAANPGYTGRVEIIAGTPAASPVAPALPLLAVELARITVPIAGGAAATVDSSFRTFASGTSAILAVTTSARLPVTAAKWQRAVALDTGIEYRWSGTAWGVVLEDTGWVNMSYIAAGWTAYAGTWAPLSVRRINGVVYSRGMAQAASGNPGVDFATLPVGFRPAFDCFYAGMSGGGVVTFKATSGGALQFPGNGYWGTWLSCVFSWPVG